MNAMFTNLRSCEEVKEAIFDMNREGAPSPNGLGAFFFEKYWDIVRTNVFHAISQFFKNDWLIPIYSNNVVLIPKSLITLDKFKFKIFTQLYILTKRDLFKVETLVMTFF